MPGVALDVALVLADEEDAGEVPGPAGSPAHPARARASRAVVVRLRRRVGRSRDVADSTRRRYVTVPRTAECHQPGAGRGSRVENTPCAQPRRRSVSTRPVVGVHGIRHDRPHAEPSRGPRRRHRSRRRLRPPPRRAAPTARPAGGHLRRRQRPAGRRRAQHAGRARDRRPRRRAGRHRRRAPDPRGAGRRPPRARLRRHGRPRDGAPDPATPTPARRSTSSATPSTSRRPRARRSRSCRWPR